MASASDPPPRFAAIAINPGKRRDFTQGGQRRRAPKPIERPEGSAVGPQPTGMTAIATLRSEADIRTPLLHMRRGCTSAHDIVVQKSWVLRKSAPANEAAC